MAESKSTSVVAEPATQNLVFAVNGERFEVSTVDPSTTLLEFLRTQTRFKSVKFGCGEGGCGSCVVLLTRYHPTLKQIEDIVANSCLTLLCSLNGCSILTSEGLGNSRDGFHPIHQRFAGFHASQCGFCTPGMSISLFSALVNAEKTRRPDAPPGFSKLTVSEAEKSIAGNLCRCTGYRPITDVCKSFAANVDIEDLGYNSFWKKGESKDVIINRLPSYDPKQQICTYPALLKNERKVLDPKRYSWHTPATFEELQSLLNPSLLEVCLGIKLVVGNTGTGYYKEMDQYDKYIDLRYIPELSIIKRDEAGIEIGATVTISEAILALKKESDTVFKKIAKHMDKIASHSIRNTASIGGNLVMAQRNNFPSDIATILLAADSKLNIMTGSRLKKVTMEEFLDTSPLDSSSVLLSIQIPRCQTLRDGFSKMDSKLLFETYRAAPRPLGNALPHLNAAFLAVVSSSKIGIVVKDARLAFGAYGTDHAIRARKVEEYLAGKMLNVDVLHETVKLVNATVVPEDGISNRAYRTSLAVGFLFQFFYPFIDVNTGNIAFDGRSDTDNFLGKVLKMTYDCDSHTENVTLLSSGKQELKSSCEYFPVGAPIVKSGAALQASGEAVYVDDIPSPKDCLHGAFIYSTKPLARIKNINFKDQNILEHVAAVFSYKDIPKGGANVGAITMFGHEPLFADDVTQCAGQRVAFLVANTQKCADMAANMAVVEYDTENLESPILTVEEAVEQSSFFEVSPFLYPSQVGDFSKGFAEADHRILSCELELGSQYYFYMETHAALAVPDEDDCMVVYSSIQCPENAHIVVARCLGIPEHNVRVITRRVGGGFGGKAMRSMSVAAACALAAHKLRRPVRICVNRKTDMILAGGRHPMKITYTVGFKSSGKITALNLNILINAGMSEDISPILPQNLVKALKKYDWGALSFDIKVCKTNHSSKSAMRAPGEAQGSFIAEAVIEHVASMLSLEVDLVRNTNLHTFNSLSKFYAESVGDSVDYTLPSMWNELAQSSSFVQRIEMIKHFNQSNTWLKRGISRVPIVHEVMMRPTPGKVSILWDGSIVVEVGGIELGQGLWTKVRQMTAFALRPIECDGVENLLDKIRVIQSDTLSLIQGGFTAGSTTSESSCEAVRLSCNILVERLIPFKKKLIEQKAAVDWDSLICQANLQAVNLSASSYFIPERASMQYLNYGAAVSEVEINILTGETRILQADIIYDCGQSLNPAVDLGQIEGAFVQGIGFFMQEEYLANSDGLVVNDSTWTYKIPTVDTIPEQFNVRVLNSGHHQHRILSSKASGEPPLLLAVSVYCAARAAITEARKQLFAWGGCDEPVSAFQLKMPATMPVVKELCGLDNVEWYLKWLAVQQAQKHPFLSD